MSWDDLRYVLTTVRKRTLSSAAETLGVTHTTVGRRLKSIEDRLGVRLFDRTPEGYMPTQSGVDLAEVAELMEAKVLSVEARVRGRDEEIGGKLRVSMPCFVFLGFSDAFSSFVARYPEVELTVSATDEEVSLARREADVAIRLSNAPPDYLVGRKVGRIGVAAYGAVSLVEKIGADAPYNAYPWLHFDERSNPREMDRFLAEHAPDARIAMRVDSTLALRQALLEGIGIQLLPCFDGDAHAGMRRIGPVQVYERDLWLLTHPDLRSARRVRAFLDHLYEHLFARLDELTGVSKSED